ncbi:hypothetical protein [Flavobacterium cerinum]|uniref:Uncharacterized protein n=1 Tax=Flavobacterium cerinum TaxID=2502784 RepID=A0A444HEU6_9FLAO|nr:hypothetical protein [Flavobacterium cerinum]RWX03393.1 hypothetical protein EPI11_00240 [Flavobacterium cerinum]
MMNQPEQIREEILNELDQLMLILQYSSEKTAMLSTGERIMINQERAALFRALAGETIGFLQTPEIEQKKNSILKLINRSNWKPKEIVYE